MYLAGACVCVCVFKYRSRGARRASRLFPLQQGVEAALTALQMRPRAAHALPPGFRLILPLASTCRARPPPWIQIDIATDVHCVRPQPYRTTPLVLPGAKVKKEDNVTECYLRHHPNPMMRAPPGHGGEWLPADVVMKQKVSWAGHERWLWLHQQQGVVALTSE